MAYPLDGIGYNIAGTFLVAVIGRQSWGWAGTGAWILVGMCVRCPRLQSGRRRSAAAVGGIGAHRGRGRAGRVDILGNRIAGTRRPPTVPRAAAFLTTGYSVGQKLRQLLYNGYHSAPLVGAAAAPRMGFP